MRKIKVKKIITVIMCVMVACMGTCTQTLAFDGGVKEMYANIKILNDDLQRMGTSVEGEFEQMEQEYYDQWVSTTNLEEKEKLQELICQTKMLSKEYERINGGNRMEILSSPSIYDVYASQVATVITWFSAKGYKLAAELLTHARYNTDSTSWYCPINGNRIKESYIYYLIWENPSLEGDTSFWGGDATIDQDLYYALHKVHFAKTDANTLWISDWYDYEVDKEYTDIAGVAVQVMTAAQGMGVITPYSIIIQLIK